MPPPPCAAEKKRLVENALPDAPEKVPAAQMQPMKQHEAIAEVFQRNGFALVGSQTPVWKDSIRRRLSQFGMTHWLLDYNDGPNSNWNANSRLIFQDTFSLGITSMQYCRHFPDLNNPNPLLSITTPHIVGALFDKYFFYLRKCFRHQATDPDYFAHIAVDSNAARRRNKVSGAVYSDVGSVILSDETGLYAMAFCSMQNYFNKTKQHLMMKKFKYSRMEEASRLFADVT